MGIFCETLIAVICSLIKNEKKINEEETEKVKQRERVGRKDGGNKGGREQE